MLEKLPGAVGRALQGLRAGLEGTAAYGPDFAAIPDIVTLTSAAFTDGGAIPDRFTEDGDGVSPPLAWTGVPEGAGGLALLIEDADSPTPAPIVHAIIWNLPAHDGGLPEGELPSDAAPGDGSGMGKNSYLGAEYLPPDPPPGHGPHRYVVQLFATKDALRFDAPPGRKALLDALRGNVLAKGVLIGTYQRE